MFYYIPMTADALKAAQAQAKRYGTQVREYDNAGNAQAAYTLFQAWCAFIRQFDTHSATWYAVRGAYWLAYRDGTNSRKGQKIGYRPYRTIIPEW